MTLGSSTLVYVETLLFSEKFFQHHRPYAIHGCNLRFVVEEGILIRYGAKRSARLEDDVADTQSAVPHHHLLPPHQLQLQQQQNSSIPGRKPAVLQPGRSKRNAAGEDIHSPPPLSFFYID